MCSDVVSNSRRAAGPFAPSSGRAATRVRRAYRGASLYRLLPRAICRRQADTRGCWSRSWRWRWPARARRRHRDVTRMVEGARAPCPGAASRRRSNTGPRGRAQALWASRPLAVHAGRRVAVRLQGEDLQVGLAAPGGVRWVRPEAVLANAQAQAWAAMSAFSPGRRRG